MDRNYDFPDTESGRACWPIVSLYVWRDTYPPEEIRSAWRVAWDRIVPEIREAESKQEILLSIKESVDYALKQARENEKFR